MPKYDFNKVAKQGVNLLHIFRTPFPKNTSRGLLLFKRIMTFTNIIILKTVT